MAPQQRQVDAQPHEREPEVGPVEDPDVSVICGEPSLSSIDANALSNPTMLVEVTSRGTEDYDRGDEVYEGIVLDAHL